MILRYMVFLCVCQFLSACASAPVVSEHYYWPPLPDQPRIEWIKEYKSQLDIQRSASQRLMDAVMGVDSPISLVKPVEVKSDPNNGRVFVADLGIPGVVVFDNNKHEMRRLSADDVNVQLVNPLGIALDADGNIYVLERRSNMLVVFDATEKPLRVIELGGVVTRPAALAINRKLRQLIVADGAVHKVFVFSLDGKLQFAFGGIGGEEGQFNLPISVTIGKDNDIIVADTFNARIQIFDAKGSFKRAFGSRGDGLGDFQLIKSVAVDSDDNIYVVDGRSHDVKIFNQSGEFLMALGSFYPVSQSGKIAPGGFAIPVGIDIDGNDSVYVVDQLNQRVQVFQYLSDSYLARNPLAKPQM